MHIVAASIDASNLARLGHDSPLPASPSPLPEPMGDLTDDTTPPPSLREDDSDSSTDGTTPPASLREGGDEQYDNRLRNLVRGCTVEYRKAYHDPWASILVGDLVDQMPEPSYTTFCVDRLLEVRFAGKVFRCEATDGVMTLAAMVHVFYDLFDWVDHCMSTGFQGAPANWSYAQDEGSDHEPTRAHPETTELPDHSPRHGDVNLARLGHDSPLPASPSPLPEPMGDLTDDTTPPASLREDDSDSSTDRTTPPASLREGDDEQYDNRLRNLVRGCTVEYRKAYHDPWASILVGDLVDQMPEPSYTTFCADRLLEVRFAGKVFRCEATDGVMTLAAMVHAFYDLFDWVDHCMSTGFQGAPANWSYAQDEGSDHEPTRAHPETTELPDHSPRHGDVNLARLGHDSPLPASPSPLPEPMGRPLTDDTTLPRP
ncbi:hypothetical protein CYMTET_29733 [Cymbomonas tetramitiformis]|uniref:Uncharacterized protein n=1 Tax=Cymbomonas tetramitiformis TaxID=36881 RepID=A0AAE0FKF9_9CHLO|nr:hypothetical protein CYMTET_29733 [Cymbomonas tetramitiformis]